MLGYYVNLGLRGLRRNPTLTALMVLAIAMGIASWMTVLAALRALSADPIPAKARQLYSVRIDNWGPSASNNAALADLLSYPDASALMRARAAFRQTAMYSVEFGVTPQAPGSLPFTATARAVYTDFFSMFDVPFAVGAPWDSREDESHADVVVLGASAAARLFPAGDAVGSSLLLAGREYRVIGVLQPWLFQPRIYDLTSGLYQRTEDIFLPLTTAVDGELETNGEVGCPRPVTPGFTYEINSECRWLQFWVELPTLAAVRAYRQFLIRYAEQQRSTGRLHWVPKVALLDVPQTLAAEHIVPDDMRLSTGAAFGFLLVCLLNAMGLMLARLRQRRSEFSVRRALGAARLQIMAQCLSEGALAGLIGGVLGLGLLALGLIFERAIVRQDYAPLIRLDPTVAISTVIFASVGMLFAALLPGWIASRRGTAWRLRAE